MMTQLWKIAIFALAFIILLSFTWGNNSDEGNTSDEAAEIVGEPDKSSAARRREKRRKKIRKQEKLGRDKSKKKLPSDIEDDSDTDFWDDDYDEDINVMEQGKGRPKPQQMVLNVSLKNKTRPMHLVEKLSNIFQQKLIQMHIPVQAAAASQETIMMSCRTYKEALGAKKWLEAQPEVEKAANIFYPEGMPEDPMARAAQMGQAMGGGFPGGGGGRKPPSFNQNPTKQEGKRKRRKQKEGL